MKAVSKKQKRGKSELSLTAESWKDSQHMSLPEHNCICLVYKVNQREKDVKMSACHIVALWLKCCPEFSWVPTKTSACLGSFRNKMQNLVVSLLSNCTGELLFLALFPTLDFPFTYTQSISLSSCLEKWLCCECCLFLAVLQKLTVILLSPFEVQLWTPKVMRRET